MSIDDRRVTFAAAGLAAAAGAPLGLLAVSLWLAGTWSLDAAITDVRADLPSYLYVTVSTAVAFTAFGAFVGSRADYFARLSTIDPLTGLPNARAAGERLNEELARAVRYQTPLSFVLADVDGLKQINDTRGHAAGDEAIRHVAAAIRDELRTADFAARRSGDEFLVIAPATEPEDARALAERIIARLGGETYQGGLRVTASIGVAGWAPGSGESPVAERLQELADAALYVAKKGGRNVAALARGNFREQLETIGTFWGT